MNLTRKKFWAQTNEGSDFVSSAWVDGPIFTSYIIHCVVLCLWGWITDTFEMHPKSFQDRRPGPYPQWRNLESASLNLSEWRCENCSVYSQHCTRCTVLSSTVRHSYWCWIQWDNFHCWKLYRWRKQCWWGVFQPWKQNVIFLRVMLACWCDPAIKLANQERGERRDYRPPLLSTTEAKHNIFLVLRSPAVQSVSLGYLWSPKLWSPWMSC